MRPTGTLETMMSPNASSVAFIILDWNGPGAIALTKMPSSPSLPAK